MVLKKLLLTLTTVEIATCLIVRFPEIIIPENPSHARVFGGSVARDGQFPYMAMVLIKNGKATQRCSAALISDELVLLAAHCFPSGQIDPTNTLIVAGKVNVAAYAAQRFNTPWDQNIPTEQLQGVQERRAENVVIHDQYSSSNHYYDMALVKVSLPFVLNRNISPIDISYEKLTANTPCTIHGWGKTENTENNYNLVFAPHVLVQPIQNCNELKSGPLYCLVKGNAGICQGDSGSPLICDGAISGVASFLMAKSRNPQCGEDFEEFYSDVSYGESWLENKRVELSSYRPPTEMSTSVSPKQSTGGGRMNKPIYSDLAMISLILISALKYL